MAFYGKARVGTVSRSSARPASRSGGSSGSRDSGGGKSSSEYKNNRGETIPTNRSGKPIYTPDPIQSPGYYKAPEDPFKEFSPEGYGPDQFGVAPPKMHMPTRQLTPEEAAAYARGQDRVTSRWDTLTSDPRWIAAQQAAADARASGDRAAWMRANGGIMRVLDQIKRDNQWGIFHADPDADYPKPRSVSGNYQYGEGRPGPTPPGVAQGGGGATSTAASRAGGATTGRDGLPREKGGTGGGFSSPMEELLFLANKDASNPEGPYGGTMSPDATRFHELRQQLGLMGKPIPGFTPQIQPPGSLSGPRPNAGGTNNHPMIEGYLGAGGGPGGGIPQKMQGMLGALSGSVGALRPTPPPTMSTDSARKAAMGLPAHLLDPNYKPGSRSR